MEYSSEKWELYKKQAAPKISRTTGMKISFVKEKFSHDAATSFPLTGRHSSTDCRSAIQVLYSNKRKAHVFPVTRTSTR
jgi:hypothetical protein